MIYRWKSWKDSGGREAHKLDGETGANQDLFAWCTPAPDLCHGYMQTAVAMAVAAAAAAINSRAPKGEQATSHGDGPAGSRQLLGPSMYMAINRSPTSNLPQSLLSK